MVQLTTRERVDAFWSSTLGVDAADCTPRAYRSTPTRPTRSSWRGVYVLAFDKAVCVFAPADLLDAVAAWHRRHRRRRRARAARPGSACSETTVQLASARSVHHYRDDRAGLAELAGGRRINPRRRRRAGRAARRRAAATSGPRPASPPSRRMLFGLFEGDDLRGRGEPHPRPRRRHRRRHRRAPRRPRQGLRRCASPPPPPGRPCVMHGVARFRALATSPATLRDRRQARLQEYGRNLAVYLHGADACPVSASRRSKPRRVAGPDPRVTSVTRTRSPNGSSPRTAPAPAGHPTR